MEPFSEILEDEWPTLLSQLQADWPKSFILTSWLNTRFQWMKKSSGSEKYSFRILAPGGDIQSGLVTYGKTGSKIYYLTVYLFNENTDKIKNAILETKLIDWNARFVCGVPTGHETWFKEILCHKGYTVHHDTPTIYYIIPRDVPQTYDIKYPEDVYIDYLKQADISKINGNWQHAFEGSDNLLCECIKMNYGIGVYLKENNELLSWIIKYEYGDMSILQTDERYKRRGYAKLVTQSICKRASEDGEDCLVHIVPGNTSSENLFTDLGAQPIGGYNYVEFE